MVELELKFMDKQIKRCVIFVLRLLACGSGNISLEGESVWKEGEGQEGINGLSSRCQASDLCHLI